MTTAERVKDIVAELLGVEIEKVTDQASLMDDLGADSLDGVELVMTLEQKFGIQISDDECQAILTVGDAVKLVDRRLG